MIKKTVSIKTNFEECINTNMNEQRIENLGLLANSKQIKIQKRDRATFFASIITGLLCHGFSMTNILLQHDTIASYSGEHLSLWDKMCAGSNTGRWATALIDIFSTNIKTPFFTGVLIILIAAAMAIIINKTLSIKSLLGCILVGVLIESFPSMLLYHTLRTIAYPTAALLAIVAVYVVKYFGKWILGGIILGFGLAVYPPMISMALVLIIIVSLRMVFSHEKTFNIEIVKWFVKCFGSLLVGGMILLCGSKFLMSVADVTATDYMGADEALSGDGFISQLPNRIVECYKTFYRLLYSRAEIYPSMRWIIIVCCLLIFIAIIYLFFTEKVYESKFQSMMALVLALFIPPAMVTMNIISRGFSYRAQHRMAFVFIYIAVIMFGEMVFESLSYSMKEISCKVNVKNGIFRLYCAIIALISMCFAFYDNAYYFNEALITQKDQALMTRILVSLKEQDGFDMNSSPVYFATYWDESTEVGTSPLLYDFDFAWNMPSDGESHMIWFTDALYKSYMKTYLGVELQDADDDISDEINCNLFELNKDSKYADDSLECGDYNIELVNDKTYVVIIRVKTPTHYSYSV